MEENKRRREQERRRELRRRQVMRQRLMLGCGVLALVLILIVVLAVKGCSKKQKDIEARKTQAAQKVEEKKDETVSLLISAAGDCTLGTDEYFNYSTSLNAKFEEEGAAFFFENVKPVFSQDDLTIVNMEGTLTEETSRAEGEEFAFKGDADFADILVEGSVEAANLANNHTYDYGDKSYTDTIDALDKVGIPTFGYDRTALMEIKGVKVGLLGTYELDLHMDCEEEMIENIESLKEQGAQIIIATFHWGIELDHVPNDTQVTLAHSAIDHGADLVLGHHPHVLQGIETYKGKNIIYSLANFCFGGNSSPNDMDSMIYQQTFTFKNGELQEDNDTRVIPVKVSSVWETGMNNYQPTPVEGDTGQSIIDRIEEYSQSMAEEYGTEAAQIAQYGEARQTISGQEVEE